MVRYLIQIGITPQSAAAVMQNPQNRQETVRPLFESVGGRLNQYYIEVGGSTAYLVAEMPDQESVGAVNAAILASGAVASIKATAIVTAEEAVDIFKKAANVAYKPPTG